MALKNLRFLALFKKIAFALNNFGLIKKILKNFCKIVTLHSHFFKQEHYINSNSQLKYNLHLLKFSLHSIKDTFNLINNPTVIKTDSSYWLFQKFGPEDLIFHLKPTQHSGKKASKICLKCSMNFPQNSLLSHSRIRFRSFRERNAELLYLILLNKLINNYSILYTNI